MSTFQGEAGENGFAAEHPDAGRAGLDKASLLFCYKQFEFEALAGR
jgi:hypothetical protein